MGAVERAIGSTRAPHRLLAVTVAAGALALGAVGCGSSGDAAAPTTLAPAVTSPPPSSTTADETSSTTTPGAAAGAAILGAESGGESRTERTTTGGADVASGADEVAPSVDWSSAATDYRGSDGLRVSYDCPPDGTLGSVWGSLVYTDDSSVCTAAVHVGLIDEVDGGEVTIEIGAGLDSYLGSTANGVTTSDYGPWSGSYTFPDA